MQYCTPLAHWESTGLVPGGVTDRQLALLAACGTGGKGQKNASRNLHRLIVKQGRSLPIDVTFVPTPVRMWRGKVRAQIANLPVLLPSTWLQFMLSMGGELILGGHNIQDDTGWRAMFRDFWRHFDRCHPGIERNGISSERAIPCCVHGDEGRGRGKRALMVVSIQPLISWLGPAVLNSSGNPSCILGVLFLRL